MRAHALYEDLVGVISDTSSRIERQRARQGPVGGARGYESDGQLDLHHSGTAFCMVEIDDSNRGIRLLA